MERGKVMELNHRIRFSKIFCPVDPAHECDAALRYAITLATMFEAELHLCHCFEKECAEGDELCLLRNRELEEAVLRNMRTAAPSELKWSATFVNGIPRDALAREARRVGADLLVIQTRARGIPAIFLGSTAESLCHLAGCPVLVIREEEREWVGQTVNEAALSRVTVAFDFTRDGERALAYGLSLAQEFEARLDVLHVLPKSKLDNVPGYVESDSPVNLLERETINRIRQAIPPEADDWCDLHPVIRFGNPAEKITEYVEANKIELLVLGVRGIHNLKEALFGSTVDKVLPKVHCPALVARPLAD